MACSDLAASGKVLSARDVRPDTGLARLSYGQAARALLDPHTAHTEPGTGRDLHEYRHSGLTRLGEQGASELMLCLQYRPGTLDASQRVPA
ncbi:hypothetical protein [Kitasatospora sp. NBC_00458]|uniref:hypothetical protein n=1 Tax=Kitasatospora sp. NBC_00458 TaxID=2903568 RepID=UPI003FA5415E